MVKVGFLVEGDTEKKIISSDKFREFCFQNSIEIVGGALPPKGYRGKDRFVNAETVSGFIEILKDQGAEHIIVIRDLEDLDCIVKAREEIKSDEVVKIIVVKAIESWFVADSNTLTAYFEQDFHHDSPESIDNPFDYLKNKNKEIRNRGINDKLIFAGNMLRLGFSIENAANHPNCPSARYFINKLQSLSKIHS
jgi:hypothetical protein